jgi:hypothetical protein
MKPYKSGLEPMPRDLVQRYASSAFTQEKASRLSDQYNFVSSASIIAEMEKNGWQVSWASEVHARREEGMMGTQRHAIRFRQFGDTSSTPALRVGDTFIETMMVNSHDGNCSFRFLMALFRLACSNGMVVAESTFATVRIRHNEIAAKSVLGVIEQVTATAGKVGDRVKEMQNRKMTQMETIEFATAAARLRWPEETVVDIPQIVVPRRQADADANLWSVYNVAQENIISGRVPLIRTVMQDSGPVSREVRAQPIRAIKADIRINQGLWELAERFL